MERARGGLHSALSINRLNKKISNQNRENFNDYNFAEILQERKLIQLVVTFRVENSHFHFYYYSLQTITIIDQCFRYFIHASVC